MAYVATLLAAVLSLLTLVKWLRVAQREHYIPGRTSSCAMAWLLTAPWTYLPALAAVSLLIWSRREAHVVAAALALVSPVGLPLLRPAVRLKFTPRAARLAGTALVVVAVSAIAGSRVVALVALLAPVVTDALLAVMRPVENLVSRRFVRRAAATLAQVKPIEVAITGSYGKTTTKNYLHHLISDTLVSLPTPGSWNNLLGVTRTVNERLTRDVQVFIAEMGTYGPGEIREICSYFPPKISCIVSIGDAHLERMGSRDVVATAKREILERAGTWILNIDCPELAAIADEAPATVTLVRCSTSVTSGADVVVSRCDPEHVQLDVAGRTIATVPAAAGQHPINLAVAVAAAVQLGVPQDVLVRRLSPLPVVQNRGFVATTKDGVTVVDDTFNSNPVGARRAVGMAVSLLDRPDAKLWVVSPGMFELGDHQFPENRDWARSLAHPQLQEFVIVGRSNRRALLAGAQEANLSWVWFGGRPRAVEYVNGRAASGDVILYENDRPDHLP